MESIQWRSARDCRSKGYLQTYIAIALSGMAPAAPRRLALPTFERFPGEIGTRPRFICGVLGGLIWRCGEEKEGALLNGGSGGSGGRRGMPILGNWPPVEGNQGP